LLDFTKSLTEPLPEVYDETGATGYSSFDEVEHMAEAQGEEVTKASEFLQSKSSRSTLFDVYKYTTQQKLRYDAMDGKPILPHLRPASHLLDPETHEQVLDILRHVDVEDWSPENKKERKKYSIGEGEDDELEEDDDDDSILKKSHVRKKVLEGRLPFLLPKNPEADMRDLHEVREALKAEFPMQLPLRLRRSNEEDQNYDSDHDFDEDERKTGNAAKESNKKAIAKYEKTHNHALELMTRDLVMSATIFERERIEEVHEDDTDRIMIHEGRPRKMSIGEYRLQSRKRKRSMTPSVSLRRQRTGSLGPALSNDQTETEGNDTTDWETEGYMSVTSTEGGSGARRRKPRLFLPRVKLYYPQAMPKPVSLTGTALRLRDAWLNVDRWYREGGVGARIRNSEVVYTSWADQFYGDDSEKAESGYVVSRGGRENGGGGGEKSDDWTTADEGGDDNDDDDDWDNEASQGIKRKKKKEVSVDEFMRLAERRERQSMSARVIVSSSQRDSQSFGQSLGGGSMAYSQASSVGTGFAGDTQATFASSSQPQQRFSQSFGSLGSSSRLASSQPISSSRRSTIAGFGRIGVATPSSASSQLKKSKRKSGF
jgi:hypothetical protein